MRRLDRFLDPADPTLRREAELTPDPLGPEDQAKVLAEQQDEAGSPVVEAEDADAKSKSSSKSSKK